MIPTTLLEYHPPHHYEKYDRRDLLAVIDTHKSALRAAAAEIEQLQTAARKAATFLDPELDVKGVGPGAICAARATLLSALRSETTKDKEVLPGSVQNYWVDGIESEKDT